MLYINSEHQIDTRSAPLSTEAIAHNLICRAFASAQESKMPPLSLAQVKSRLKLVVEATISSLGKSELYEPSQTPPAPSPTKEKALALEAVWYLDKGKGTEFASFKGKTSTVKWWRLIPRSIGTR